MRSNLVDVEELEEIPQRHTEKAYCFSHMMTDDVVWLPKSQVEINDDGTVTMPRWLAIDKELI